MMSDQINQILIRNSQIIALFTILYLLLWREQWQALTTRFNLWNISFLWWTTAWLEVQPSLRHFDSTFRFSWRMKWILSSLAWAQKQLGLSSDLRHAGFWAACVRVHWSDFTLDLSLKVRETSSHMGSQSTSVAICLVMAPKRWLQLQPRCTNQWC